MLVYFVLQTEVLTVFEMVGLSSKEICGFVIGETCASDYNPWQQNWNVTIPGGKPPVTPVNPPKVCQCLCQISSNKKIHYPCSPAHQQIGFCF